jgi:hypothetical protein
MPVEPPVAGVPPPPETPPVVVPLSLRSNPPRPRLDVPPHATEITSTDPKVKI